MPQDSIVIAGGGTIGLAIALELRRQGASIAVIDDARPGFASVAAAGMLAANDPENPPELRALSHRSLTLYPDFLSRICTLADDEIHFETSFTLQLSKHAVSGGRAIDPSELHLLLPALEPLAGYSLLTEHSLDPRRLHALLRSAAVASGTHIVQGSIATVAELDAAIKVTLADSREISAQHFIDCRGAWLPTLRPRKGQLVRVELAGELSNPAMGNIVLRTPDLYIVPRLDGTAIIGATVEDCGYDLATSEESTKALIHSAAALVPAIATAPVIETWSGLRPFTSNGLPVIGRVSDRILVAGGHFRNGILLAPATADAICSLLQNRPLPVDLAAFQPDAAAYQSTLR